MVFFSGTRNIFIDAHVHFYPSFSRGSFFQSAYAHFAQAARAGGATAFLGVLFLAESGGLHWFDEIASSAHAAPAGGRSRRGWKILPGEEKESLLAVGEGGRHLLIVAGRQIATAEGLEVIALASAGSYREGGPLLETVEMVRAGGGLPLLPWGAGKWTGKRADIVRTLILQDGGGALFLGDNGGRPRLWPKPSLFRLGESRGIRILPGSDPLPLPHGEDRAGSFGFSLDRPLPSANLLRSIREVLSDRRAVLRPFGTRVSPQKFIIDQFRLRIRPRR